MICLRRFSLMTLVAFSSILAVSQSGEAAILVKIQDVQVSPGLANGLINVLIKSDVPAKFTGYDLTVLLPTTPKIVFAEAIEGIDLANFSSALLDDLLFITGLPSTSKEEVEIPTDAAGGILASIPFDGAGLVAGEVYSLAFDSDFAPSILGKSGQDIVPIDGVTFEGGSIAVVPEASSILLSGITGIVVVMGARLRRRTQA